MTRRTQLALRRAHLAAVCSRDGTEFKDCAIFLVAMIKLLVGIARLQVLARTGFVLPFVAAAAEHDEAMKEPS